MGRDTDALELFLRVLLINPEHADALFNLGISRARVAMFPEAAGYFKAVLALRPDRLDARAHLDTCSRLSKPSHPNPKPKP